jgi:hypothetical protein
VRCFEGAFIFDKRHLRLLFVTTRISRFSEVQREVHLVLKLRPMMLLRQSRSSMLWQPNGVQLLRFARCASQQTSLGCAARRTCVRYRVATRRSTPAFRKPSVCVRVCGRAIIFLSRPALPRKSVKHGSVSGPEADAGGGRCARWLAPLEKFHPVRRSGRAPAAHDIGRG